MQDEITQSAVTAIEPALSRAETQRIAAKRPEHMGAWDFCRRGTWYLHKATESDAVAAYRLFEKAIALDPDLADGHVGVARALNMQCLYGSRDFGSIRDEAEGAARQAIALDDENAVAQYMLSRILDEAGDAEAAIAPARRAIELNANFALAYFALAGALNHAGHHAAAIDAFNMAQRLSPRDRQGFMVLSDKRRS